MQERIIKGHKEIRTIHNNIEKGGGIADSLWYSAVASKQLNADIRWVFSSTRLTEKLKQGTMN